MKTSVNHSGGSLLLYFSVLTTSSLITACGSGSGSGEGLDENGQPLSSQQSSDTPTNTNTELQPNLNSIQSRVFTPICAECHQGSAAPVGLRLDSENNSFDLLVNVTSGETANFQRVAVGDPDNSYLIQKLEGTAAVGSQMPLGKPPLPQSDIDVIRQWISDGALQSSSTQNKLATLSLLIPNNKVIQKKWPQTIEAIFSQPMDSATLDNNSVTLVHSGPDHKFGNSDDVQLQAKSIELIAPSYTRAVIGTEAKNLGSGLLKITLQGDGETPIKDQTGEIFDGNNNGKAGGNFTTTLHIQMGLSDE